MVFHPVRSALLGLGLVAGLWAPAQAAPVDATLPVQTVQYYEGGPREWRPHHRDREWHGDRGWRGARGWREESHGRRDGFCRPGLALDKAARMGVRGADIVRVTPRSVTVAGFRRGHPIAVRFAQVRGCPVIGGR